MFFNLDVDNFSGVGRATEILTIISIVVATLFFLIYLMQHIHAIVSLFTKNRKWKDASKNHKYGFLIAGRNESAVIGNLIDSIYAMDYPRDLIRVFVCADNCTDDTSKIAKDRGAIVFERFDTVNVGKSYAMDYMIKQIASKKEYDDIEAFLVFDADNLVSRSYLKEMNKSFDEGYEVLTSFRESKNFKSSWVSGCSSLAFYRECLLVHHSREHLGLGTYVSGTGYLISRNVLNKLGGWSFNTMTEDIEFSIWCATNNILISFNENAIFYDEQPESLKVANTQRLRWCKGTHECSAKYNFALLKSMFVGKKKLTSFELFTHVTPFPIMMVAWIFIYLIASSILFAIGDMDAGFFTHIVLSNVGGFIGSLIVISMAHALISVIRNKERLKGVSKGFILKCVVLFPFYVSMFIPLSVKALFKKVKWKPIPHTNSVTIASLECGQHPQA